MATIRKFFSSLGLKSLKLVGLIQENHVIIFVNHENDYSRLMLKATWYVSGAPMNLFKWSTDFHPSCDSPVVPVWIGFPGLPIHLFAKTVLFSLASAIGSPLKIDERTVLLSRPTVARVCVDLDVSKPKNYRLWIGDEKEGFWQEVVYENSPEYCSFCKKMGHEEVSCFKKNPDLKAQQTQNQKEVEKNKKLKRSSETGINIKDKEKMLGKMKVAEADESGWIAVSSKEQSKRKLISKVAEKELVMPDTQEKDNVGGTSSVVVWRKKDEKENGKTDQSRGLSDSRNVSDPSGSRGKVVVDVVEIPPEPLSISQFGKPPAAFFHKAIALTPLPDVSKFKNKKEGKFSNSNKSEPSKQTHKSEFQCRRLDCSEFNGSLIGSRPLDQVNEKSQPFVSLGNLGALKIQPSRAEERETFSSLCQHAVVGTEECGVDPSLDLLIAEVAEMAKVFQTDSGGDQCEPFFLIQNSGQDLSDFARTVPIEKAEVQCQTNKIQPLINTLIQIQPSDHQLAIQSALDAVRASPVSPVNATDEAPGPCRLDTVNEGRRGSMILAKNGSTSGPLNLVDLEGHDSSILWVADKADKDENGSCQAIVGTNEIQPLDRCPTKIQPLDGYALIKKQILAKAGSHPQSQSDCMAQSRDLVGPDMLDSNGLSDLNPMALAFQPAGLLTAGPSLGHHSKDGLNMEGGPGVGPGCSSEGPKLLEDVVGPSDVIPINSKGEILVAQTRRNYLHLKEPLFQFLQGRGISLTSMLKDAVINFLSNSSPPISALSRDNFKWDSLQKYFFLHIRNLNIKISLSFRCAMEQFFQCLENILLEKNLKVACFSSSISVPSPTIESSQDQNFLDSPVLAFPQIEGPPQDCSSVNFS